MQSLLEFAPLVAFGVAFYLGGIYTATAVLMVAMALLLIVDYAVMRRIPPMHAISAVLVFAFGAATLVLHDQRFIQWKPTVLYWLAGIAFLASNWVGEQPLVQRMLGRVLDADVHVAPAIWRRLNWLWVLFWLLLGVLNLVVALNASVSTWAWFKVLGPTLATVAFVAAQLAWLTRRPAATPLNP
jgi:intracellular septation protein